jgi:regulator of sirC expression with transglutaminase-like and TPR domain
MSRAPLADDFRAFATHPASAVEGALLVARVVQPATDVDWCRAELRRLAAEIAAAPAPLAVVAHLHAAGFAGATDYYTADNSVLESVLRRRRGIPISLAMVVIGVGEALGLRATGINFPRHFLAMLDDQLVDPFRMRVVARAECRAWLAQDRIAEEDAFRPASPRDVVMRMLNNLRLLAQAAHDHARVLELSDYQLLVAPAPFYVHLERVASWLALGAVDMARHELEEAERLAPDAAARTEVAARLRELAPRRPTLH